MRVKTIASPKENAVNNSTTTTGSVVVLNNNSNTIKDINGQIINPDGVNTNELNVDQINSNNITNSGSISTDVINANSFNVVNMNVGDITISDLNVSGEATFSHGLTALGTSEFNNINSVEINNADNIITKNLTVTGAAHFFELVIDKIKSAGGSILLTPADGFTIDYLVESPSDYTFYYRATEEPAGDPDVVGRVNMWAVGDGALCQSYNASADAGSTADNKYYWVRVIAVSASPVDILFDDGNEYPCHWVKVDKNNYDGALLPTVGDEIVMLGNDRDVTRQSAIYEAAYNSLDPGIQAPLIACYQGINDFNLSSHRKSYFDKTSARFVGDFTVESTGQDIEDYVQSQIAAQSGQTHVEFTNQSGRPIQNIVLTSDDNYISSNFSLIQNNKIYLYDDQGNIISASNWATATSGSYLNINNNQWSLNSTSGTQTVGNYTLTWTNNTDGSLTVQLSSSNNKFNWGSPVSNITASLGYNNHTYVTTVPVSIIPTIEGADGELYKMFAYRDIARVDWLTNTLKIDLKYGIQHIVGDTTNVLTSPNNDYMKFTVYGENSLVVHTVTLTPSYWTADSSNNEYYYRYYDSMNLGDISSSAKPIYIKIELYDANDDLLDQSITNVVPDTTSLFYVTDGMTTSIQSNTTSITSLDGRITTNSTNIAQLTQTADRIQTRVESHEETLNTQTGDIDNLQQQYSEIEQTADGISARVTTVEGGLTTTGIDITNGQITLGANNTNIIGNLNIYNSDTGLIIYDDNNRPKVVIQKSEIPTDLDKTDTDLNISFNKKRENGDLNENIRTFIYNKSIGVYNDGETIFIQKLYWRCDSDDVALLYKSYNITFDLYKGSIFVQQLFSNQGYLTKTSYNRNLSINLNVQEHTEYFIKVTITTADSEDYNNFQFNGNVVFNQSNVKQTYIGMDGMYSLQGSGNVLLTSDNKTLLQRSYIDELLQTKRYYGILLSENYKAPQRIIDYTPASGGDSEKYYVQPLSSSKKITYVEIARYQQSEYDKDTYYLDTILNYIYSPYLSKKVNGEYELSDGQIFFPNSQIEIATNYAYTYILQPSDEVIIFNSSCFNTSTQNKVGFLVLNLNKIGDSYGDILPGREIVVRNNTTVPLYIINEQTNGRSSDRHYAGDFKSLDRYNRYNGVDYYAGMSIYTGDRPVWIARCNSGQVARLRTEYTNFWTAS